MRVLLDENLPIELAEELPHHEVDTVVGIGWSGLTNGELLGRAAATYDALVTMDRNIEHQQDPARLPLAAILVLDRQGALIKDPHLLRSLTGEKV